MNLLNYLKLAAALILIFGSFQAGMYTQSHFFTPSCPVCPPTVSNHIEIRKIKNSPGLDLKQELSQVITQELDTAKELSRKEKRQLRRKLRKTIKHN